MNKLKYDIQRSFGGWCISIDNGYTVTYQYDVNDNIIAIIRMLESRIDTTEKCLEKERKNWEDNVKHAKTNMEHLMVSAALVTCDRGLESLRGEVDE